MAECLNKRQIGDFGENLCVDLYEEQGFRLVDRNWHFHRMGEIDLILEAPEACLLIFCEVKLRRDPSFAAAGSAVNRGKRLRIRKLAQCYLMLHPQFANHFVRFDVCEVFPDENGIYTVNLIPEAF